jgi:hypothetical protein
MQNNTIQVSRVGPLREEIRVLELKNTQLDKDNALLGQKVAYLEEAQKYEREQYGE